MPTYGYRCSACTHSFDQVQRFSDDPLTICPECGGSIRRIFHPVGVVFKGSGWYITDSRKPESSGDSDSGSGGGPGGKSKSAGKDAPAATKDSAKTSPSTSKVEAKPAAD